MTDFSPNITISSFSKTFRKVFPKHFLHKHVKRSQVDRFVRKLFFINFIMFLLLVIMLRPSCLTTRELETKSQEFYLQHLTGMPNARHSSIAQRLAKIPPCLMDTLLEQAQQCVKSQCHWKSPFFPKVKVFDTTTWSVPSKQYQWAANNGKRSAARFVFVMDQRTGAIERIIDAHMSTSDNDVFEQVIRTVRRGEIMVFDRGYNRFTTVKRIREQGGYFITRWKSEYAWQGSKKRKLSKNVDLEKGWQIIDDEEGTGGADRNPGQMYVRRITCWHPPTEDEDEKFFIIWTDLFKLSAKKLVQIYVSRWSIEVFFRHVKSSLRTIHFPTRSEDGIHNWLILVALSVIFMLLLTSSEQKGCIKSPGERHYPFLERWRQVEILVMNEAFMNISGIPPKPPPRPNRKKKRSGSKGLNEQENNQPLPSQPFQGVELYVTTM